MMMVFFFFVLGLVVGSFCNVVIFRLANKEGGIIAGRSHCRDCQKPLAWYDNIPILSFVFLHGKCRHCTKPLSWQYPLVELAGGFLFALVAYATHITAITPWSVIMALLTCGIFAAMLIVFVYDMRYMEVPMVAIWFAIISALAIMGIRYATGAQSSQDVIYYIIAGGVAFLFFFSLSYFSGEKWMGYGDAYIALVIGLLLGPLGSFVAILLAVWVGAIVGIFLAVFGGKTLKSAIPFGPFLVGGMYVSYVMIHFFPTMVNFLRL